VWHRKYSISSVAQCFQGMSSVGLLCTSELAFVLGAHLLCNNETFLFRLLHSVPKVPLSCLFRGLCHRSLL